MEKNLTRKIIAEHLTGQEMVPGQEQPRRGASHWPSLLETVFEAHRGGHRSYR
jgi:hypothetical protein